MLQRIIIISGKAGSGKSTLSTNLAKTIENTTILNYADPVYEAMYEVQDNLEVPRHKNREMLQAIGNMGRSQSKDFWIKKLIEKINLSTSSTIIIGDARFPDEINILRDVFGDIIFVVRLVGRTRDMLTQYKMNISETSLDSFYSFDLVINTGLCDEKETLSVVINSL